jgi:pSer/pThr/pTyr-binding forkhead associated (FHA) protein
MECSAKPFVRIRCLDDQYSFDLFAGEDVVVGRDASRSNIVVSYRAVARCHARFCNREGRCFVEDMRTLCGTRVNGRCIGDERRELFSGDQVQLLPEVVFVIETDESPTKQNQ